MQQLDTSRLEVNSRKTATTRRVRKITIVTEELLSTHPTRRPSHNTREPLKLGRRREPRLSGVNTDTTMSQSPYAYVIIPNNIIALT
jgi:hypothetical protein